VVASAGDTIGDEVEVIDSIKGSLKSGTRLRLPALKALKPVETRQIEYGRLPQPNEPLAVTCQRMVLFLRRAGQKRPWMPQRPGSPFWSGNESAKEAWLPASQGGLKANVAFIELGHVYAFVCEPNLDVEDMIMPYPIMPKALSENELRNQIGKFLAVQTDLLHARH
jgi:hypothetical protein